MLKKCWLARLDIMLLASTQKLYDKIAKGDCEGFTVPAFNIRTLTFEVARALFRAAKKEKAGAFIIELAQSEMDYTDQSPQEYVKYVTKAARKENFKSPLFIQGDHFKPGPENPKKLEKLITRAIKTGFYNIDIDCSKLTIKENSKLTAYFTNFIRKLQPKNLTISVGGEIGEIGGKNTTLEDFQEFIEGYNKELGAWHVPGTYLAPVIKVAVQTGTSHGRGGKTDFQLLENLTEKAKEYNIAGVVQHGASTLSEEEFKKFPASGTLEIHLATEFQNIILNSPYFPQELKEKIHSKKELGPFKKQIWAIPRKNIDKICQELEEKFIFFFKELNVSDTSELIRSIYP